MRVFPLSPGLHPFPRRPFQVCSRQIGRGWSRPFDSGVHVRGQQTVFDAVKGSLWTFS
jgi:hypothetical protein